MELILKSVPSYLLIVTSVSLIGHSLGASLAKEGHKLINSTGNDDNNITKDDDWRPNCSRADLTFTEEDSTPKQSNGTVFLPDFDPTVVLNIVDALVNGDVWNDIVSGVRTVLSHWRERLAQFPNSPSSKSFPDNSTNSIDQRPLVAFD